MASQHGSRQRREEYLVGIARLPHSVPTYADNRRDPGHWLRLEGLDGGRA